MAAKRSNPTWSEEKYIEQGLRSLHLRLPARTYKLLEDYARARGVTRAELVTQLLEKLETDRTRKRAARNRQEDREGERARTLEEVVAAYRSLGLEAPPDPFKPDLKEIKAVHRRWVKQYHPDRWPPEDRPRLTALLTRVNKAYDFLKGLGS